MKIQLIRNSRGQIAIFIALLFQVLFLFFAMIVNVGLLVHHKINLQNSVDLAAYYGAMKQAEVLNAIAHVNYQIRQSWKLLVWRQRVLGSAGAMSGSQILPWERLNENMALTEQAPARNNPNFQSIYREPRFCITYDPHLIGDTPIPENSCRSMHTANRLQLPDTNVLRIPGFYRLGALVATSINNAIQRIEDRCAVVGAMNYIIGGRFTVAHDVEAAERAHLIKFLSSGLSENESDFFEIGGESARIGTEKTFMKNLTDANRISASFRMLNGLGLGQCRYQNGQIGRVGGPDSSPAPWLVPIEVYPVWRYLDCNSQSRGSIDSTQRQLVSEQPPALLNTLNDPALRQAVSALEQPMTMRPVLIGYEKDPWCMPYVGVKATARPRIPFMPLSDVEIRAEAYSKPFGGRIGPWYVNNWPQSQSAQNRINQTANSLNIQGKSEFPAGSRSADVFGGQTRVTDIAGIANLSDPSWIPNISRFPGDSLGYASEQVLGYFHRAIKRPASLQASESTYARLSSAGSTYPFPVAPDTNPSVNYYESVGSSYADNPALDQLTWDSRSRQAPKLRLLEIAGIAPNLFDLAYYSIEPNFYGNYYQKIKRHTETRQGWGSGRVVLGDLGSRFGDVPEAANAFNVMDQIKIQRDLGRDDLLRSQISMPYAVKNAAHLLNSWSVNNLLDYTQNESKFGQCVTPASGDEGGRSAFDTPINPAIPGNCINGGRVGYSVKAVAREYLRDPALEIGGQGVGGAAIRNPPPQDW